MNEPTVFAEAPLILGESLVWHDDTMWWCDISAGVLHNDRGGMLAVPPPLASFGPTDDGRWVASFGAAVGIISSDGSVEPLADIPHRHPGMRLNEGKCDPVGRWVTGSMELTRTEDPDAAFYSISNTGEVRVVAAGLGVANGLEWSLDGSRVYFTDTSVETIYTAAYTETGEFGEPEVFHSGAPHDGLAIDRDGCLWSAHYGLGVLARYDPDGKELDRTSLPALNVTSVAFGGVDLSTVFVASARENLSERQLVEQPLAGSVFAISTETAGRAAPAFRVAR